MFEIGNVAICAQILNWDSPSKNSYMSMVQINWLYIFWEQDAVYLLHKQTATSTCTQKDPDADSTIN